MNNIKHKRMIIIIVFIFIFVIISSAFYADNYYNEHRHSIPIRMTVDSKNNSLLITVFAYRNSSNEFSSLGMVGTPDDLIACYLGNSTTNNVMYYKQFTYNISDNKESYEITWNWTFDVHGKLIYGPLDGYYRIQEGYWSESSGSYASWDTEPFIVHVINKNNIKIMGGDNIKE